MIFSLLRPVATSLVMGSIHLFIMIGLLVASVLFTYSVGPNIDIVNGWSNDIYDWIDDRVAGTYWPQLFVNHLHDRVNMVYVLLSIPAMIISALVVWVPLNWFMGGIRSIRQRLAIALVTVPTSVVISFVLFATNALSPPGYAFIRWAASRVWRGFITLLHLFDGFSVIRTILSILEMGVGGHSIVMLAFCYIVAAFGINMIASAIAPNPEALRAQR